MEPQIAILPESNPAEAPLKLLEGPGPEDNGELPGHEEGDENETGEVNGRGHKRRWSMEEMRKVAAVVAKQLRKQGLRHVPQVGDYTGRQFLGDFVREAQIELPVDRRRINAPLHAFSPIFFKLVEDALAAKPDTAPALPAPPVVAPVTQANGSAPVAAPAHPVPPADFAIVPENDPLANIPLRVLLREVNNRILGTLDTTAEKMTVLEESNRFLLDEFAKVSAAHEKIMQRLAGHDTAFSNMPAQARQALPRVAIIACRKDELDHIERGAEKHGLKLDFRLYEQNSAPRRIDADWAIMMRFGGHEWQDQVNNSIPSSQSVFTNGGVSSVIAQLRTWFQPGFKAAAV